MSEDVSGRRLNPDAIIDYQDDSIVSRILLKSPAGSVTLFAFDGGQELSEHTTPYDALVQIVDGEAEISISGIAHPLHEGDLIILPANEPHSVRATGRFKMLLVMLK